MTLEEIAGLPIPGLANKDARLFLWTTNAYNYVAHQLIDKWGFKHKQTLIWHKTNASPYPASIAVANAEFLLVANRGRPKRMSYAPSSVISAPIRRHSEKPEVFQDMVEQVSPGPYLEMFARRKRSGWDSWGDEVESDVELLHTIPASAEERSDGD